MRPAKLLDIGRLLVKAEWLRKLREKRNYLMLWLERVRKAQEVIPFVHRDLELTDWEIAALENSPEEADEIAVVGLSDIMDDELAFWKVNVSMMPPYDVRAVSSSSAYSTSGTASFYSFVSRIGDLDVPGAAEYSGKYTVGYQDLQQRQDREGEVRRLIETIGNPQTLERFDRTSAAYHGAQTGTAERTSAAFEMRTLLDGIQGDLFEKARSRPGENMTWATMAQRLAKGGQGSVAEKGIRNQENPRSSLIDRLSRIGKDREGSAVTDLGHIWTQLLDHVYAVLGLAQL